MFRRCGIPVIAVVIFIVSLFSTAFITSNGEAADIYHLASASPFCKTIKAFAVAEPPTFVTISTYHVWARLYLPSYEKLASEAPTSSVKKLLKEVVVILKYEEKATSVAKLKVYVVANGALWNKGVTQLFQSAITCSTTA